MSDIVDLIMADHARIRELLAGLDDAAVSAGEASGERLAKTWSVLADLFQVHLDAAEEIAYPGFSRSSDRGSWTASEMTADHGDIREALNEARIHPAGSVLWWLAVRATREAGISHIGAIESGPLPAFRRRAAPQKREALGGQWAAFVAARIRDENTIPD